MAIPNILRIPFGVDAPVSAGRAGTEKRYAWALMGFGLFAFGKLPVGWSGNPFASMRRTSPST
jgi:hypothetical protein